MKTCEKIKKGISTMVVVSMIIFGITPGVFCLPENPDVLEGNVRISTPDEATMNIEQASDKAVIDWHGFSIALGETVNFLQPSTHSTALNRVTGGSVSKILGTLNATGTVWLLNPSGINFGPTARINTASFLASTLNTANTDFLNDSFIFSKDAGTGGYLINKGQIEVNEGGYVSLLGEAVENDGIISAKLGKVILASGEKMALELDDLGLISVAIEGPVAERLKNEEGETVSSGVKNAGLIAAEGGSVVLTASVLGDVFESAVNNEGLIRASSIVEKRGEVYLLAEGPDAVAENTGEIDVSAIEEGADGGLVEISGAGVRIDGEIKASGKGGLPGSFLLDPVNVTIIDGAPGDDDSGSTVGEDWLEARNGFDITIQADCDIDFELTSDDILDLAYFDTEVFTLEAGGDINLNDDMIQTAGGGVRLLADYYGPYAGDGFGDVNLGTGMGISSSGGAVYLKGANLNITSPIDTRGSGGNVDLEALYDIVHGPNGDIMTGGGNYTAVCGEDFLMRDGSSINAFGKTMPGIVDITAGSLITLGSVAGLPTKFDWEYLGHERSYKLLNIGYYYKYCSGDRLVLVPPFIVGSDIVTGSGTIEPNLPAGVNEFGFYVTVKEYDGTQRTYYTDPILNPDGYDHVKLDYNAMAKIFWEDMWNLGDADFNDVKIGITPADFLYGSYIYGDRVNIVSLDGSIAQNSGRILAEKGAYLTAADDMAVNNVSVYNGGVFLKAVNGSIFATEVFSDPDGGPGQKNVAAKGYSYFSAPSGTIGVGTPADETVYNPIDVCIEVVDGSYTAVPTGFTPRAGLTLQMGGDTAPGYLIDTGDGNGPLGVSGAIRMVARPGVTAITGLYPSPDIDLISDGGIIPPGYAFYEEIGEPCCDVSVTPPPRFTGKEGPGTYDIITQIWPGPRRITDGASAATIYGLIGQDLRFKIPKKFLVDTFQITYNHGPIELTSGQVFFYHPLFDMNMYEMPAIGIDAYEFIEGAINTTRPDLLPAVLITGEEEE